MNGINAGTPSILWEKFNVMDTSAWLQITDDMQINHVKKKNEIKDSNIPTWKLKQFSRELDNHWKSNSELTRGGRWSKLAELLL
jgi:hypothetical protein